MPPDSSLKSAPVCRVLKGNIFCRTKGIIRSANHEPEDLVPMKVARREPVESKVNRFGTAERVSVHDQVDEDDDVSARQKISSKVVVMRKINEKQR